MKWARGGISVALVAIVACAACGSFGAAESADAGAGEAGLSEAGAGAEAAAACLPDTCADAGPSCSVHDFANGCGNAFGFVGDTKMAGVVGMCTAEGKARVAADDTLDITAELGATTPGLYESIRVSARIGVKVWDGRRALTIELDRVTIAEIDVVMAPSGRPVFNQCSAGDCAGQGFEANVGEEHLFAFDITSTSVSLSVDCVPFSTRPANIDLAPMVNLLVKFGHTDAQPIDGTIDDVGISFR